jgi:precorrin-6B methylase 1
MVLLPPAAFAAAIAEDSVQVVLLLVLFAHVAALTLPRPSSVAAVTKKVGLLIAQAGAASMHSDRVAAVRSARGARGVT